MKKISIVLGMCRNEGPIAAHIYQRMAAAENSSAEYIGNREIADIDEELLRFYDKKWYALEDFKPNFNSQRIKGAIEKLKAIVQKLSKEKDMVVIYDPKITELLPVWEKVLNGLEAETQYIWLFQNPLEAAESLQKRNGYSKEHGLLLWIHYNLTILKFLSEKSYQLIDLDNSGHGARGIRNLPRGLSSTLYESLVRKQERELDISDLEKQYTESRSQKGEFIDYQVLENIKNLHGKEIIIYGAGGYGKRAARMLSDLECDRFDFCDKSASKQGTSLMGGRVFSVSEIESRENLLFIVAIENMDIRKEMEQTLSYIKGARFLSFLALNLAWNCLKRDYTTIDARIESLSSWYENLGGRGSRIDYLCSCPVLVYQNGKVGSSTVSVSLRNAGIENIHIHRFLFVNDIHGRLLLGDEWFKSVESSVAYRPHFAEYMRYVKSKMKHKKIITLVRDPIAVNLSSVFQWIEIGIADRYIAERLKKGRTFAQAVSDLMIKIQDRLFNWFSEELKELCGIDVFAYPFDKEKGYTIISQDTIEVLVIKTEKLSQMTEVIQNFMDNRKFELLNTNVGSEKEYAHIYKEVKKHLVLPRKYVEYYYIDNPYMDHFYSREEQNRFLNQWMQYVKAD